MSAFRVSERHIRYLVAVCLFHEVIQFEEANEFAEALRRENDLSLAARYNDPLPESWADPEFARMLEGASVALAAPGRTREVVLRGLCGDVTLAAAQVVKAARCFAYQACEHDGWQDCRVNATLQRLLALLPEAPVGYNLAAWAL